MDNRTRLEQWAKGLTVEQLQKALVDMVDYAIDIDYVHFGRGCLAPYWEGSGEPIVPGQKTYEDDEE